MDIKRYDVGGDYGYGYCDEEEQGDWVLFDDHYAVVASLQSELTKALELLDEASKDIGDWLSVSPDLDLGSSEIRTEIENFLAHQSAPAAKGGSDE